MSFDCLECEKSYRWKSDLKSHYRKKHPNVSAEFISRDRSTKIGKNYPCPYGACISGYTRFKDMKRHVSRKHENVILEECTFHCPINGCKKSYSKKRGLDSHIRLSHIIKKEEQRPVRYFLAPISLYNPYDEEMGVYHPSIVHEAKEVNYRPYDEEVWDFDVYPL